MYKRRSIFILAVFATIAIWIFTLHIILTTTTRQNKEKPKTPYEVHVENSIAEKVLFYGNRYLVVGIVNAEYRLWGLEKDRMVHGTSEIIDWINDHYSLTDNSKLPDSGTFIGPPFTSYQMRIYYNDLIYGRSYLDVQNLPKDFDHNLDAVKFRIGSLKYWKDTGTFEFISEDYKVYHGDSALIAMAILYNRERVIDRNRELLRAEISDPLFSKAREDSRLAFMKADFENAKRRGYFNSKK